MPLVAALGLVEPGCRLALWTIARLARDGALPSWNLLDGVREPVSRVGDLLVWNGADGQRVLGGIESLQSSSQQIQAGLARIEDLQFDAVGQLHRAASFALVPLGMGVLAAAVMVSRLAAIEGKLALLAQQMADLKQLIAAGLVANLASALKDLEAYETCPDPDRDQIDRVHHLADLSRSLYQQLLSQEIRKGRRIEVLSQFSRYLALAILADTRALMHAGKLVQAEKQLAGEWEVLRDYAQALFDLALAGRGGLFLHADFAGSGITLEVLSEAYWQARTAGLTVDVDDSEPAALHEALRKRTGGSWLPRRGSKVAARTAELKYLLAGLEDVNRIQALRLRLKHALENGYSAAEIEAELGRLREESRVAFEAQVRGSGPAPVMAYRFAAGTAAAR